jgi:hypothetical protein
LYEQNMPRRQVAVKVLLSEVVNDQVRQMFQAEANLMAQLSAHPSILTVYQASVSADGRPYLVMELCSPALGTRYRAERLPVADVLRIAVRIGSAVETAHRAGVLHRDIKPSNILLTAYGHPVLSDFGIAATLGEMEGQESVGMSIPWSAPEVLLDESPGSVRAEVWSVAATVYSLLAGRSPFEIPGGSNASSDLIHRITRGKPQPINRPDVPQSLDRLLTEALSRKPDNRPASVLDLIHGLQAIETELGVAQTPIEVAMDDWAHATVSDLDDKTQIRAVSAPTTGTVGRRRRASGTQSTVNQSAVRTAAARRVPARRGLTAVTTALLVSSALVLALGITAAVVIVRAAAPGIPVVSDISATLSPSDVSNGTVEFSWRDPGVRSGDVYSISTGGAEPAIQRSTDFVVDADPGARICVTVTVNREGKAGDASGEKCVDVPE